MRLNKLLESDIYVCLENDEMLAYGALKGDEVSAFFVYPNYRGKGVGQFLLEFLLSKNPCTLHLFVVSTNTPAKNLYAKYGFDITEIFESTYNQQPVLVQKMVCARTKLFTGK